MSSGNEILCGRDVGSMGYNIANCEMIRTKEELAEKLGLDGSEDQHTIMNNMVDARACYKPSGKVSRRSHLYTT